MMESLQKQSINRMVRTFEKELSEVEIAPKHKELVSLQPNKTAVVKPKIEIKKEKPIDKGFKLYETLLTKLYDRNHTLGNCFKTNIVYHSYQNNILTWKSSANKEDKTLLKNHWSLIRMFVQDIFGFETKIKNIPKELP